MEIVSVDGTNLIFKGFKNENLYLVSFGASKEKLSTCLFTKSRMSWLWHRRLAHVGMKQLDRSIKHDLVMVLKDVKFEKDRLCSSCQAGKQVANTHPNKSMMSTSRPLKILHMDLFGATTYMSIGGNKYDFVIVDDFSIFTWLFFLNDKSEVFNIFKSFIKKGENEF